MKPSHQISPRRSRRRGTVLIGSIIMITIAALAVSSWLFFVVHGMRAADRDRARTHAFYAAEAGVERVVSYFNIPSLYTGAFPDGYDSQSQHPATIPLQHAVYPDFYDLFEPYILDYARNSDGLPIDASGNPIWDSQSNSRIGTEPPVVTAFSYFANPGRGGALASVTSKIPTGDLEVDDTLVFLGHEGEEIARVTSLRFIHPSDFAPGELAAAVAAVGPVIGKVVSIGRSPSGTEVSVETLITESLVPNISSPAAIISEASVTYNGRFEVYWGEVWSKSDVNLPGNYLNMIPRNPDDGQYSWANQARNRKDPWFAFRTNGVFRNHQGNQYADGRERQAFNNSPLTPDLGDLYYQPFHPDYLHSSNTSSHEGLDNMRQHQELEFPNYDYDEWKRFFQLYDLPYFWTDASGTVYGRERDPSSNNYGEIVGKSYQNWFGVSPSDPNYNEFLQQFAFIDSVPVDDNGNPGPTVDGIPVVNETYYPRHPNHPAAVVPTISVAGGGTHTRGAMFINADMDMSGQGNPPGWQDLLDADGDYIVRRPDGTLPSSESMRISHSGLMYSWGQINLSGNRTFYGSVHAEKGYAGNGTPEVYYNARLRDGSWLNINQSRVSRTLWDVNQSLPEG